MMAIERKRDKDPTTPDLPPIRATQPGVRETLAEAKISRPGYPRAMRYPDVRTPNSGDGSMVRAVPPPIPALDRLAAGRGMIDPSAALPVQRYQPGMAPVGFRRGGSAQLVPGSFHVASDTPAPGQGRQGGPQPPSRQLSQPAEQQPPQQTTAQPAQQQAQQPARTATSVSGRDLGYGEMVNGVRTFSDGLAPGTRQTVTPEQIEALGNRVNVMPAEHFARPAPGVAYSMATGGRTPELGSVRRPRPANLAPRGPTPEQRAAESALWRQAAVSAGSGLGVPVPPEVAARNLQVRQATARTEGERDHARALQQALPAAVVRGAELAAQGEQGRRTQQTERERMLAEQETARMNAATTLDVEQIRARPTPQMVTLSDGTLGFADPSSPQVTRPTLPDGQPAHLAPQRDAAGQRSADAQQNRIQRSVNAYLQQLVPPGEDLSPDHLRQARYLAYQAEGLPMEENPETGAMRAMVGDRWVEF